MPSGNLPLNVTFKLPVSEISEIDDHKSVRSTMWNRYVYSMVLQEESSYANSKSPNICHWLFFLEILTLQTPVLSKIPIT